MPVFSPLSAAIAFLALAAIVAWRWRLRPGAPWLVLASLVTALWAAEIAYNAAQGGGEGIPMGGVLELGRGLSWVVVLFVLLLGLRAQRQQVSLRIRGLLFAGVLAILFPAVWPGADYGGSWHAVAVVLLAVSGLVLVEQLYRNTPLQRRWEIKGVCLALGAIFAFDLFLFADLVLFQGADPVIWHARGAVNALVVPLLALSAGRITPGEATPAVSRRLVFHTVALLGVGVYLLGVGVAAYFLRHIGGDWGGLLQVVLLFGAGLLLALIFLSGSFRAWLRVILAKYLFRYRYDYRHEWLRLTRALSEGDAREPFALRAVQAIAETVDSPGGLLWVEDREGHYALEGAFNAGNPHYPPEPPDGPLVRFMAETGWVIDLPEYRADPSIYGDLTLPDWLDKGQRHWAVIPLLLNEALIGFVVLDRPRAPRPIDWEDRDLLKTAGRQLAVYVALIRSDEALLEARQFEAFHRLSAFLVHDLKNVSAQLALIQSNAARHQDNPAFVSSAFATVGHARERLERTLSQLRNGRTEPIGRLQPVELGTLLVEVVCRRAERQPVPELTVAEPVTVMAERERLLEVLEHLVRNAQEATPVQGWVRVEVGGLTDWAYIAIQDSGVGMDDAFLRERLFRPFQTTKGNAGMGIGVYEAREYVRRIGGRIEVESAPGRGSCFTIRLPARRVGAAVQMAG
ncbi:XrtA/PEP-CTERM system histidine kinase PrsK [Halorhodospira sp. 9622]|uniref:XrtA/PEP-CTERM system histidine kinase PrsK n=1 Tax=Halorhodospira sp. 9622 TaxID=2899136 RepID=UPI001EE87EC3|nr:XrtA/PEP-CTERM system histidine kinase PrsK [Halorhodospira sp. 9622]MCG5537265.1 PEP-CTERM system histidine kinase PrsK [Halorhodospira sp. 9622]